MKLSWWNMFHVQRQRLSQKRTRCYHSGISKFNRKTIIKLNKGCHKHPTIILPKNYSIITYSTSKFSLTNWFQQQWWFLDFMMINTIFFKKSHVLENGKISRNSHIFKSPDLNTPVYYKSVYSARKIILTAIMMRLHDIIPFII